eukprot:355043-Chlamydomonas_euryale.AAC.5
MWHGGSAMNRSAAGFHAVMMMRRSVGLVLMRWMTSASWSTPWPAACAGVGSVGRGARACVKGGGWLKRRQRGEGFDGLASGARRCGECVGGRGAAHGCEREDSIS